MADTLYLSLWYPNLRLAGLAEKLTAVLGTFAKYGGESKVYSATVWPVSWSESPVFQQVYGHARWVRQPRMVRVNGYGPLFDEGAYEQDGHVRIDFGSDAPFLDEELELDSDTAKRVEENVRQLVELTTALEKESAATARLLWSELGESLARRLAARLGMAN
jgi:hypothetical protein